MISKTKLATAAITVAMLATLAPPRVLADEDGLKLGIRAYNQGRYKDAIDKLGAAMHTDVNNAVLYYYLANSHVHLGQRDACIREFRIAYALEPDQEVGKLSKQALTTLGAGNFDEVTSSKPRESTKIEIKIPKDPHLEKALEALNRQAGSSVASKGNSPVEIWRKKAIKKSETRLIQSLLQNKSGPIIPPAAQAQLESLRILYGQEAKDSGGPGQIKQTANNLQNLLQDKKSRHRLVPHGTNLYVRNYQSMDDDGNSKPPQRQVAKPVQK